MHKTITPNQRDNVFWRKILFAKPFTFTSIHNAYDTTIKLAELVCYASDKSDLRRLTDFVRRSDKHYDMTILVKHDMGKRAYYTSTIVTGRIEIRPDGETVLRGVARFGSSYLLIVILLVIFCGFFMLGSLMEPVVAALWGLMLIFIVSHLRQMFTDRNAIIQEMQTKVQKALLTEKEREESIGEWQSISPYAEGNFYNTQAR